MANLIWHKIEPNSRKSDFLKGIQASIHDPAWMLARQWQLGEFEGEDAGSPVYVKMSSKIDNISKVILGNSSGRQSFEYRNDMPLETLIERTKLEVLTQTQDGHVLDLQMRVKIGLQFQQEMDVLLKPILNSRDLKKFKQYLASENQGDPKLSFQKLNDEQDKYELDLTKNYLSAIRGRVIDIYQIFNHDSKTILQEKAREYFRNRNTATKVGNALEKAYKNLKEWWEGEQESFFEVPSSGGGGAYAWDPRHLEYSFKVQIGSDDTRGLILDSSEYKEDHLDWYSFTVDEDKDSSFSSRPERELEPKNPVNLRFAGMPEKRWWNFEDSHINFGAITPTISNIATTLLMEFALIHAPDWYIIPQPMEVGSISRIESFRVIDSFGDETLIEPAGQTKKEISIVDNSSQPWNTWSMFLLSRKYKNNNGNTNTRYFFLPPSVDNIISSPPMEEIKFLRDEIANMVWAVERKYRTLAGEPTSGYDHFRWRQRKLEESPMPVAAADNAIKYTLMTSTVPWNWIPFTPVHADKFSSEAADGTHYTQIELQRSTMIGLLKSGAIRLYPNSRLLNEVKTPYYIDESEVPRSGVILWENYQRAIWSNGKVFLWIGRKKSVGSGEGSSGLRFDSIPIGNKT